MGNFVKFVSILLVSLLGAGIILFMRTGLHKQLHMFSPPNMDVERPILGDEITLPAVLVFSKTSGWRHHEAITAAADVFRTAANKNEWAIYITENGAIFNEEDLERFSVVVWNNATGQVLTQLQKDALRAYIEEGGGFMALHAAGDGSHDDWPWFVENVIRADYLGAPQEQQVQSAKVIVTNRLHPITNHLPKRWPRKDEWFGFSTNPRGKGVTILARLNEMSYNPEESAMGKDHPIMWVHQVGEGRVFYSAMGHTATAYQDPDYAAVMEKAMLWTKRTTWPPVELEEDINDINGHAD